jgi:hypothetical protein
VPEFETSGYRYRKGPLAVMLPMRPQRDARVMGQEDGTERESAAGAQPRLEHRRLSCPPDAPPGISDQATSGSAAPATPDPRRWHALAVSQVAALMSLLDVSIVNVALPSIERGLAASAGTAQWVVSGYALTMGLVLVAAGRLGDLLGRRRMFLIALSAFVVTSGLSGAAPSMAMLIAARLLQGVAAGMLIPQNSGLIQDLFRGAERGRAFGILGATVGLSTAAGPVIGGLILSAFPGPDG